MNSYNFEQHQRDYNDVKNKTFVSNDIKEIIPQYDKVKEEITVQPFVNAITTNNEIKWILLVSGIASIGITFSYTYFVFQSFMNTYIAIFFALATSIIFERAKRMSINNILAKTSDIFKLLLIGIFLLEGFCNVDNYFKLVEIGKAKHPNYQVIVDKLEYEKTYLMEKRELLKTTNYVTKTQQQIDDSNKLIQQYNNDLLNFKLSENEAFEIKKNSIMIVIFSTMFSMLAFIILLKPRIVKHDDLLRTSYEKQLPTKISKNNTILNFTLNNDEFEIWKNWSEGVEIGGKLPSSKQLKEKYPSHNEGMLITNIRNKLQDIGVIESRGSKGTYLVKKLI